MSKAEELANELNDELKKRVSHVVFLPASLATASETELRRLAQHQEPPQQERKPMTHIKEQARSYQVAQLAPTTGMVAISSAAYIELYERHHGIFAEPAQGIKE